VDFALPGVSGHRSRFESLDGILESNKKAPVGAFGTSRVVHRLLPSQRGLLPLLVRLGALSPVQGLRPTPGRSFWNIRD
jgi:hypothetical protein